MKKLLALLAIFSIFNLYSYSQDSANNENQAVESALNTVSDSTNQSNSEESTEVTAEQSENSKDKKGLTQEKTVMQWMKKFFIEGGPQYMAPIFLVLILGLAIAIERIIYLNLSTTNTKSLISKIKKAMDDEGVEGAMEVCRNTRGPVASIFYQGLDRSSEGVDVVEKALINYGSVQSGLMEKNLSWVTLFIALAPMLGFLGTIVGIIDVFDKIQTTGQTDPVEIAGSMKIALNTTLAGLVTAIILQIFYNYIVSKIDGIVNDMEDASITLIDTIVEHKAK